MGGLRTKKQLHPSIPKKGKKKKEKKEIQFEFGMAKINLYYKFTILTRVPDVPV